MKISEVIAELETVKARHGDLICVCHNGMDPSDPEIVTSVFVSADGLRVLKCWDKIVAEISSQ